jgi:hypothetical protein
MRGSAAIQTSANAVNPCGTMTSALVCTVALRRTPVVPKSVHTKFAVGSDWLRGAGAGAWVKKQSLAPLGVGRHAAAVCPENEAVSVYENILDGNRLVWPGDFLARLLLQRVCPKEILMCKELRVNPKRVARTPLSHLSIHGLVGQVTPQGAKRGQDPRFEEAYLRCWRCSKGLPKRGLEPPRP